MDNSGTSTFVYAPFGNLSQQRNVETCLTQNLGFGYDTEDRLSSSTNFYQHNEACMRAVNFVRFLIFAILTGILPTVYAQENEAVKAVLEAKQLLDTYYGNRANLQKAAALLERALSGDSKDANAYVQAARLTVMGGYVGGERFRDGMIENYHAFIDKALATDPKNQKAYILKAEAYDIQRDFLQEKLALDKAKALGSSDPWLWMGYARYYSKVNDPTTAFHFYTEVEALGPGTSAESRRAYVSALVKLARFKPPAGQPSRLKSLAATAWRERFPTDAWTLGNFADEFVFHGLFDDAIRFSREALRTMDYGAGRLTLAVSLYGRAAQLVSMKRASDARRLQEEAARLGFDRAAILNRLEGSSDEVQRLMPILRESIQ